MEEVRARSWSKAERFDSFPPTPEFQQFQHSETQAQTLIASKRLRVVERYVSGKFPNRDATWSV